MFVLNVIFIALPFVFLLIPQYLQYGLIAGVLATPRLDVWREKYQALSLSPITRAVSLLIIWAFVTILWSSVEISGRLIELAVVSILGCHLLFTVQNLSEYERSLVATGAVLSFVATTITFLLIATLTLTVDGLLIWDQFVSEQVPLRGQSAAAYVALCWLLIGLIVTGRVKAAPVIGQFFIIVCLIGLTIGCFLLSTLPGLVSIAVGGAAFLFVSWRARLGVSVIAIVSVIYLVLAPTIHIWLAPEPDGQINWLRPISLELVAWHNTADKIFESPIFGFGFQSNVPIETELGDGVIPLHTSFLSPPRNIFLLTWLHLGLVGAIFFAGLLCAVAICILRHAQTPLQAALLTASALSILAPAVFGTGTWDVFWVASAWCIGALGYLLVGEYPSARLKPSSSLQ